MLELFFKGGSSARDFPVHSRSPRSVQSNIRFFSSSQSPFQKYLKNKCFEPPKLDILKKIALQISGEINLSDTAMIGIQHLLPSTASLFNAIHKHLKISKKNMFFTGKFYSSCPEVEDYLRKSGFWLMPKKYPTRHGMYEFHVQETMLSMWKKFVEHLKKNRHIKRIIVLDEGGHCTKTMPKYLPFKYEVAAVEQTRFGLYDQDADSRIFTLIDVARSAAKRKLESPLIASALTARVSEMMKILDMGRNKICGIIGNGAIGSALVKHLLAEGYIVIVYDKNPSAFLNITHRFLYHAEDIKKVITSSDIVFGCTGRDITKDHDIASLVNNTITLVSCSSQDIEFLSLLKKAMQEDYFTVEVINKNLSQIKYAGGVGKGINILENGFPINFDRTPKSDPVQDMELTRCLLYCGVVQAFLSAKKSINGDHTTNKGGVEMLDPYFQKLIVSSWIKNQPKERYPEETIHCFHDIPWIQGNSGGKYKPSKLIEEKCLPFEAQAEKTPATVLGYLS